MCTLARDYVWLACELNLSTHDAVVLHEVSRGLEKNNRECKDRPAVGSSLSFWNKKFVPHKQKHVSTYKSILQKYFKAHEGYLLKNLNLRRVVAAVAVAVAVAVAGDIISRGRRII